MSPKGGVPWGTTARRLLKACAMVAFATTLLTASTSAADNRAPYIIVFKSSVDQPGNLARAQVTQRGGELGLIYRHALEGYSAELPKGAVEALRRLPSVASVEPDVYGEEAAQTMPTGISRVFAPANKTLDIDEADDRRVDVDVAVIDGGIDDSHPDLNVVSEVNCSGAQSPTCVAGGKVGTGHGTASAGPIGAIDNGFGVTGIAPGARIWGVQVIDHSFGKPLLSEYIAGIDWVTAHADQIEVANSSLGYPGPVSEAFSKAMKASLEAGVVHVVAAGNQSEEVQNRIPGNYPDLISVSAIEDLDGLPGEGKDPLAFYSNFGALVDVAAPGHETLSTWPGGYEKANGTSIASPHVAGAAAILASQSDPESMEDVQAIRNTIVAEGNFNWKDTSGDGIQEPLLDVSDESVFYLPKATTEAATAVTASTATLNGTVHPDGTATTYQFEYGTTTSYGTKVPLSPKSAGSGTSPVKVSEAISGLSPNTVYHYRLVANSGGKEFFGQDEQLDTSPSFRAKEAPATITGKQVPSESAQKLRIVTPSNGSLQCSTAGFKSEMKTTSSQTLTVNPTFGGCTFLAEATTVEMRGCAFVLHRSGTLDVAGAKCESEPMQFSVWGCTVTVGPQTGLSQVSYANYKAANSLRQFAVAFEVPNLSLTAKGAGCLATGTFNTVKLHSLLAAVEGTNSAKVAQDVWVGASEFQAKEAPATITGKQVPSESAQKLRIVTPGNGSIVCDTTGFSAEMKATGAKTLTVNPTFGGCQFIGQSATVEMRGCAFVLHRSGTLDIAGAKCESEPMQFGIPSCTATVGPQTGLSQVSYANYKAANSLRQFVTAFEVPNLSLTVKGAGCVATGTFNTVKLHSLLAAVEGTNSAKVAQDLWVDP